MWRKLYVPQARRASSAPSFSQHAQDIADHPWLARFLKRQVAAEGAESTRSGASGEGERPRSVNVDEVDEDVVMTAFADLEEQREIFRQGIELHGEEFATNVIGGAWTKANRGISGDRVKCWATSMEVKDFCKVYGLQLQISFTMKLYTHQGCTALATMWCKRMQHFYDVWSVQGMDKCVH